MNRFSRVSAIVSAVAVLFVAGSAQTLQSSHQSSVKTAVAPAAAGKAVARVNGVEIPQAAFDQELRRIFPYFSMHGNTVPKEYEADVRQKALNNLINTELVYQEAKRRNLQIPAVEWQKRLAQIRKDYGSQAEFESATIKYFGSKAAFEAKLRHDMLLDKLFLIEVKRKAVVTDLDVQKFYEANKAVYVQPESVSFQTISAIFPKNATAADKQAARKRIEQALAKAKAAKNYEEFGVLAEQMSEDEYRVMMGDHKMVHRGSVTPEFERVFAMKVGDTSEIIASSAGYHIVRLNKHEPRKQLTFAELRASIRKQLEQDRLSGRNKAFHESLRKTAKVEIL